MSMTEAQLRAYERVGISRENALIERLENLAWSIYEHQYDEQATAQLQHDRRTTLRQLKRERGDLT